MNTEGVMGLLQRVTTRRGEKSNEHPLFTLVITPFSSLFLITLELKQEAL